MTKRKNKMSTAEIRELLRLKGWSQAELGRQIEVHESTISLWISGDRSPLGPSRKLLRQLLEEARAGAEPVGAK